MTLKKSFFFILVSFHQICKMIIYVLRLEENKYYVGRTNSLIDRIEAHVMGRGSEWTRQYKPKKLIKSY